MSDYFDAMHARIVAARNSNELRDLEQRLVKDARAWARNKQASLIVTLSVPATIRESREARDYRTMALARSSVIGLCFDLRCLFHEEKSLGKATTPPAAALRSFPPVVARTVGELVDQLAAFPRDMGVEGEWGDALVLGPMLVGRREARTPYCIHDSITGGGDVVLVPRGDEGLGDEDGEDSMGGGEDDGA